MTPNIAGSAERSSPGWGSTSPEPAIGSPPFAVDGRPAAYTPHVDAPPRPPRREFLPFSPHTVSEGEIAAIIEVLRSPWITTGPRARAFEAEFAQAVEASAALALNSCTAALHLALVALGVGPGDEVITTPMTFAASVNVIEHVRARPVLVDVEPDTLALDPRLVERAITRRTRVILPVHYAGHPADMAAIEAAALPRGVTIVEDAAHAFPARERGRPVGHRNIAAFSFYATKNLTTAEGGMLTGPPELLERARVLSLHGMSRDAARRYEQWGSWHYDVLAPGFKYNMTDIAAAMGAVQLARAAAFRDRRRAIVAAYQSAFAGEDALELPAERPGVEHAWHLFVLRLRPGVLRIGRDQFIRELTARNIGTSVHFIPVHLHPYYRARYGLAPGDFPVAFDNYRRALSLPLTPALSDADVEDVMAAVLDVTRSYRR